MILFTLRCTADHHFEGWFRDGAAYEKQARRHEIVCPVCGDTGVEKAPMAPHVAKSRAAASPNAPTPAQMRQALQQLRRQVESNCDYVGDRFAEEARRIHYGETDPRGIYGEASADEAKSLKDEGVDFATVPWVPPTDA
ncbi:MAG: hypothetical protein JWL84_930 [Rhodospirillales bacterium]|jgi:hypothetical protein|nr:hypothetical protein [Rhodospirillales bacterium]